MLRDGEVCKWLGYGMVGLVGSSAVCCSVLVEQALIRAGRGGKALFCLVCVDGVPQMETGCQLIVVSQRSCDETLGLE